MLKKMQTSIVVLILVMLMTGCTSGSYYTVASLENNTSTYTSMSYSKFKGQKTRTVKLDEPGSFDVEISTKSSSLDLTITDEDDNTYYAGKDLPTSTFTVEVDKAGKYEIRFEADDHKGSYKVSWAESTE